MALTLKGEDSNKNILNGIKKILNSDGNKSSSLKSEVTDSSSDSTSNDTVIQSKLATILTPDVADNLLKNDTSKTIDNNVKKKTDDKDKSLLSEIKSAVKDLTTKAKKVEKNKQVKAITNYVKSKEGKAQLKDVSNLLQAVKEKDTNALESNLTSLLNSDKEFSAKFKSALAFLNKKLCNNPNAAISSNLTASAVAAASATKAAFSIFSCPIDKNKVTQMALEYVTGAGLKSAEAFTGNLVKNSNGSTKIAAAISNAVLTTTIKNKKLSATEVTKSLSSKNTIKKIVKKAIKEAKTKSNKSKDVLTYDKKETTIADKDTKKAIVQTGLAINKKTDIYTTKSTKIAPDSLNTNLTELAKNTTKENIPDIDSKPSSLDDTTKIAIAGGKANKMSIMTKSISNYYLV